MALPTGRDELPVPVVRPRPLRASLPGQAAELAVPHRSAHAQTVDARPPQTWPRAWPVAYAAVVRPAALIGFAAAALLLGALVVGYFVALPALASSPLLDGNLARAVSAPLGQRLADLAVVTSVVSSLSLRALSKPAISFVFGWPAANSLTITSCPS